MSVDWFIFAGVNLLWLQRRKSDRNIIFRCSFIGYFFLGFHIVTTGNVFLCLTMIHKRKNIKTLGNLINTRGATPPSTNQIACVFDTLSITLPIHQCNSLFDTEYLSYWKIKHHPYHINICYKVIHLLLSKNKKLVIDKEKLKTLIWVKQIRFYKK
jgi:hypothetical protein